MNRACGRAYRDEEVAHGLPQPAVVLGVVVGGIIVVLRVGEARVLPGEQRHREAGQLGCEWHEHGRAEDGGDLDERLRSGRNLFDERGKTRVGHSKCGTQGMAHEVWNRWNQR